MNSEFITQLEPQVLPVSKTEPPTVIKYEWPESEITIDDILGSSKSEEEIIPDIKDVDIVLHPICQDSNSEEIIPDIKDIDIVLHPICQDSIKIETVPTIIKLEAVETKVCMETEHAHFMKMSENLNNVEDNSNGNESKASGQGVADIGGNLATYEQHILKIADDLNCISARSRKTEHPKITESYRTCETTSWEKIKEKIKVIKAPKIPVEPHEYTSLAKDHHVCNHCQHANKTLPQLKVHIKKMHRKTVKMQLCPYCPYKSKWCIRRHIISKHNKNITNIQHFRYRCDLCDYETVVRQCLAIHKLQHLKPEEIQYFYCYHCSYKAKLKGHLKSHIAGHFKNEETKPREKKYSCDQCGYKSSRPATIKAHKIIHLRPEESQYFYCDHCSFKSKHKSCVKKHVFRLHNKNVESKQKRFSCDHCDFKTHLLTILKKHNLVHLKPEEIQYFHCNHCSYKAKQKDYLKSHIAGHFKNGETKPKQKKYSCDQCGYKSYRPATIKAHKVIHLKPEEGQYFYCYHCSFKTRHKSCVKKHIFKLHYKNL